MPTYRYECTDCQHRYEALHSMADRNRETCRSCGGTTKRLPTAGGFSFVGGSPTAGPTPVTRNDKAGGVDERDIPYVDRQGNPRDGHTHKRIDPKHLTG